MLLYVVGMTVLLYKPEVILFTFPVSIFVTVSSILHLPVISLERLHATLRPFRHQHLTWKVYWVAIATPWILSISFAISRFELRRFLRPSHNVSFVITFATTPLLITGFSYFAIWKKTRQSRYKVKSFRQKQETHCQKFGSKWRTRVRIESLMAAKSCKEMYGISTKIQNTTTTSHNIP